LKEEVWSEAEKVSAMMKSIRNNKLHRDTYANAFKQLTMQLERNFKEFNKRTEIAHQEIVEKSQRKGFKEMS
jgi:hypothetical protein